MTDSPVAPRQASAWRQTVALVLALFLLALGLRLGVWLEVRDHPTYQVPVLDMRGNHEFAVQALRGELPPKAYYKAPLYGYFLAAVYGLTGVDMAHARLVQIVLTSFAPVLTFLIGLRLFDRRVGIIAGLLACAFWTFLYLATELLDTELACTMYLLLAYLLIVLDDGKWTKWLACGLLLGLGGTIRPNILAFAPVLAVALLVLGWRRRGGPDVRDDAAVAARRSTAKPLVGALALTIGCCVPVFAVTIRNRVVGGEWVLIGAYGGLNLYVANNPDSDSKNGPLLVRDEYLAVPARIDPNADDPWARCCLNYIIGCQVAESKLGRIAKPGEFSRILSRMAFEFLRDHPRWLARHAVMRLCWMFNAYEFHNDRDFYRFRHHSRLMLAASHLHFGIVCPLAVVGLGLALARRDLRTRPMLYYVLMLASLTFPAVLFIINARYRLPMVHLMMPFAAYGAVRVVGLFWHRETWPRRIAVIAALAGLAVFSNANLFGYRGNHKAYLHAHYLDACERAGRTDLLDQAYEDLEQSLLADMADPRPSNTTMMLAHGTLMTKLFFHHAKQQHLTKAVKYGWLMLMYEPINGPMVKGLLDLLMGVGQERQARDVLAVLRGRCPPDQTAVLAACLSRVGERYGDRALLREAVTHYKQLLAAHPADLLLHEELKAVQRLLSGHGPASKPATTTATRPTP